MSTSLPFHLRGLALLTWAAVLIAFAATGRVDSYLHPTFRPLVPAAGAVLVLLALLYYAFGRRDAAGCCGDDGQGAGDADAACRDAPHPGSSLTGTILSFLILVAPVLTAKLVSDDQFSANAMLNRWSMQITSPPRPSNDIDRIAPLPGEEPGGTLGGDPGAASYLPLNEDGQIIAEVIDLMFGIEDRVIREDFSGREVEVLGQVMPAESSNPNGDRFRLARMFMWCCAADSRPVSILVEGETDVAPGGWVRVIGTARFPVEGGARLATVQARSVTPTDPPRESMLY